MATGDAETLVESYGAVALINSLQARSPIYTSQAQPAVPSVDPVLPAGYRRIDTYA